jgi:hypothetical protein|tara:strand:- start:239 stop:364 length:126 start_codon:yes stop_codon:yes gene_type:complete
MNDFELKDLYHQVQLMKAELDLAIKTKTDCGCDCKCGNKEK